MPVAGDMVAVIGQNRKMILFPLAELPEMARGKGVRLQKYKDGGISDLKTFVRSRRPDLDRLLRPHLRQAVAELADWLGDRAQAGRQAPQGFPRNNRFGG